LARRIRLAAHAWREGVAAHVIATGGRRWGEHVEAVVIKRELVREGIPERAVALELCSLSTLENGRYTAELMRQLKLQRAMIATCVWHLPRALSNFRGFGVDAIAPPDHWHEATEVSRLTRLREGVCAWADSVMMSRQNG
jgi:uncharacterized SAM-binding protein YcdF (DUF218 family)